MRRRLPSGPDWIKMMRFLLTLPPDTLIDRPIFMERGQRRLWHWALRERPSGQVSGRGRNAPWLTYACGERADTVLKTLPAWGSVFNMAATSASQVAIQMNYPPYRDGARMWTQLYAGLLGRLNQPSAGPATVVVTPLALPNVSQPQAAVQAVSSGRPKLIMPSRPKP